jgi:hypothetical protein
MRNAKCREPVSTPDQVRDRLSRENALNECEVTAFADAKT